MIRACKNCRGPLLKWERVCAPCRKVIYARSPKPVLTCPKCGSRRYRQAALCIGCTSEHQLLAYRHIRRASALVHGAVKSGKLPSPRTLMCADCGIAATEYDHRDYSKPLEVEAVCHSCNKKRGPGLRPPADRAA